ncbi:MarR family winged helix-turn-helix transcriptional regulator [Jatrophihabitans sp. YIM 134969]
MPAFDADEVSRFRVAVTKAAKGVDRQVDTDGLTRTQVSVLSSTARLGPLSAGELAHQEGLNPTMLSRVLGKLETRGLVTRSPDPTDKRVTVVAVTPTGRLLHQRLRRDRTKVFTRAVTAIGADHAADLRAALPAFEALARALGPTIPSAPGQEAHTPR